MIIVHNFIVFEGGDGTGTSTQLEIMARKLTASPPAAGFHTTFEPSGGPVGSLIREALRGKLRLRPATLARLFAADREEHLYASGGVVERCAKGELVISDRYTPSSLVYQGIECGEELPALLNRDFPAPEALFYFDIDAETALARIKSRNAIDIYEYKEFQEKVHSAYKRLLPFYEKSGVKVVIVDASRPVEDVSRTLWREIAEFPRPETARF